MSYFDDLIASCQVCEDRGIVHDDFWPDDYCDCQVGKRLRRHDDAFEDRGPHDPREPQS